MLRTFLCTFIIPEPPSDVDPPNIADDSLGASQKIIKKEQEKEGNDANQVQDGNEDEMADESDPLNDDGGEFARVVCKTEFVMEEEEEQDDTGDGGGGKETHVQK